MADLWDRREGETRRAHAALLDYCTLGPGRSIRGLWALYRQQADDRSATGVATRKPPSRRLRTIGQWSSDNDWPDRAAAWDKHQQSQEERKWAAFLQELRGKERRVADALLEKAEQMLRFPVARVVRNEQSGVTVVEPADWKLVDATRMAAEGSKLGRRAAGVEDGGETQKIVIVVKGGSVAEALSNVRTAPD